MNNDLRHMSRAGKTFYFASLWLERSVRDKVAVAYTFCRTVDDLADDQAPGIERTRSLEDLLMALRERNGEHRIAGPMVRLIEEYPEIRDATVDLVRSCAADGPGIRIETEADLVTYSHGVAGNVGLMMFPLLGGTDPRGRALADDLGIAMQCTNIARDVLADLENARVYLPREWLLTDDIRGILHGNAIVEASVVHAVHRVLEVGRVHYRRGLRGLRYLNPRSRLAIRIAADCYAAIGERVIRDGKLVRHRAVVPLTRKVTVALRALQGRTPLASLSSGAR
jgi:phytoene synthase